MISHEEFKEALNDTLDYLHDWEKECRKDFEFASLKQWDEGDKKRLEEQGRPALVFDRTRPLLQTVGGSESTNRYEPKYLPRDAELNDVDVPYSEAANKVYRWIRDRGDFAHHESKAFMSTLICGVGCTEIYMDYEYDSDGMIMMSNVPIWEMGWDPASVGPNLMDGRYVIRDRFIDEDEIISRFGRELVDHIKTMANVDTPGRGRGFLAALFTRETDDPRNSYFDSRNQKYYDPRRRRVRLWEMHRKVREYMTKIYIPDVLGGGEQLVPKEETQQAMEMLRSLRADAQMQIMQQASAELGPMADPMMGIDTGPINYVEDFPVTKIYRSYHAGDEVLQEDELNCKYFPYQFITAFDDYSDPERRYPFGLMRSMRDPQRYANKFLSHMVHMWASNPKGGIIFESDLFDNYEEAMKRWAAADGAIPVAPGKLQSPKPKYEIINAQPSLRGVEALLGHSVSSIASSVGISEQYTVGNPADLRRTSGTAVDSIKESNMVTMSQPFDALRLYKRVQGRLILDFVADYVPEQQLVRLLGPEESEFIPAFKEGKLAQQYEVIAEEAPASKSKQMEVFNKLMETGFITQVMESGVAIPPSLAKFFPFPADVNGEFQQVLTDAKAMMDMQNQLTQMQMGMEMMMIQQQMMAGPPPPDDGTGQPPPPEGEPI